MIDPGQMRSDQMFQVRRVFCVLVLTLGFVLPMAFADDSKKDEEALRTAASEGAVATVRQLLAKGVDVNAANPYGATALSFAADKGHLEVVKLLVEHGAEVNVNDTFYSYSPVGWAAANEHVDTVAYLVQKGAEAEAPLLVGVYSKNLEMIRVALAADSLSSEQLWDAVITAKTLDDDEIRSTIIELLEKAGAKPPPPSDFVIDAAVAATYVGTYQVVGSSYEVKILSGEDGLIYSSVNNPALPLEALDETTFRPIGDTRFKVQFQVADGAVTGFNYLPKEGDPIPLERLVETTAADKTAEAPATAEVGEETATEERPVEPPEPKPVKVAKTSPNWPAFRGANASGVAEGYPLPLTWDVEKGENLLWKRAIPGRGHSCPIVWGDRLFITTAINEAGEGEFRHGLYGDVDVEEITSKYSWRIYALDKSSGKLLWEHTAHEGVPRSAHHIKATQVNATPVTDGTHLIAVLGAEGMLCYDLDGNLKWSRDLGNMDVGWFYDPSYEWGHSSSPIIYKDTVILQVDRNRDAFIAAYSLKNGSEVWRTIRDNLPSWGTPTLVPAGDSFELVTNGSKLIRAYDPADGKELWQLGPTAEVSVGTPVVGHGLVFITQRYSPVQPIYAVRPGARGDISLAEDEEANDHVVWSRMRRGTYIPTPIVYGDHFYTNAMNGRLGCYDARTGEEMYSERVGASGTAYTASPVAGDGKLYLTSESRGVFVVKAGPEHEILAENPMPEVVMATPAISEGVLYIRDLGNLYAIGVKSEKDEG
jgi:outer membrane protein assembly factor BamB